MPNWIEGTMKLRGKREDIAKFFREGLDASTWVEPGNKEDQIIDNSGDDYLEFEFKDEPHIVGTRRAFITDDYVYMEEDEGIVCVDIKQAWFFNATDNSSDLKKWKSISDEFNLDIRLFGIECGMEFTQEIIIVRGKEVIENVKQYENWDWECPFPRMGG